jgi:hypothetical protein
VWSPDSKRFAFNHSPPHAPHTSYETTALYQLSGDKWVLSPLPIDERSDVAQLVQLAKGHFPRKSSNWRVWQSSATRDIVRVRQWLDASTVLLYAYAAWDRRGVSHSDGAYLITGKFDAKGRWRIVKSREMSQKEANAE